MSCCLVNNQLSLFLISVRNAWVIISVIRYHIFCITLFRVFLLTVADRMIWRWLSETVTFEVSSTLTGLSWSVWEGLQDCDDNFAYPWAWWIFNSDSISSVLIAASIKYGIGDIIAGSVWVLTLRVVGVAMWLPYCHEGQCNIVQSILWELCSVFVKILHLKELYICKMVCIFCDIHINNNVLSSFVFSLQYLHHKNRINQLITGFSKSMQGLIVCICICGCCNYAWEIWIWLNHSIGPIWPSRVSQTILPQLLNNSTFAWLLHVVVLLYTRNLYFIAPF